MQFRPDLSACFLKKKNILVNPNEYDIAENINAHCDDSQEIFFGIKIKNQKSFLQESSGPSL